MKTKVQKARLVLKDLMREFEPAKDHAVGAGREFLLALRSAIDAEIALLERAAGKRTSGKGTGKA